ncbi:hypothetical protein ACWGIB_03760 [Streptomyces xiamenensis]
MEWLPGARGGAFPLHLAMPGLMVNERTVPEPLAGHREREPIEALVNRLLLAASPPA